MSVRRYVQQGMAMIGAVGHQRKGAGAFTLKEQRARKAKHRYEAQIAALQAEREEMRAALWAAGNQERTVGVSDYEWHVELAAKGLAQRDKYPMPPSVTTAEGFYEVMAGAALDATGLRDLLERVARTERNLEVIHDALRQADAKAENARHRKTEETAASETSIGRSGPTSDRVISVQVTHSEPQVVESCDLASSVVRTMSWTHPLEGMAAGTGRWLLPHQRSPPPRVGVI